MSNDVHSVVKGIHYKTIIKRQDDLTTNQIIEELSDGALKV